ncbi:MAG: hypothetical protein RJB66_1483 [Pseudomonadota bacterium]|jgi:methylated-DNA-[protein]-cysteine S-methyltransferase
MNTLEFYQRQINTSIGELYLVASNEGIRNCFWEPCASVTQSNDYPVRIDYLFNVAESQINEFLKGDRRQFTLPLDIRGTDFQVTVWEVLLKIPFGEVCTYSEVARRMGSPRSNRAVGSAIGKNPLCLFIPCHRVIRADGSLGGFSGGNSIKEQLLLLEKGFGARQEVPFRD